MGEKAQEREQQARDEKELQRAQEQERRAGKKVPSGQQSVATTESDTTREEAEAIAEADQEAAIEAAEEAQDEREEAEARTSGGKADVYETPKWPWLRSEQTPAQQASTGTEPVSAKGR